MQSEHILDGFDIIKKRPFDDHGSKDRRKTSGNFSLGKKDCKNDSEPNHSDEILESIDFQEKFFKGKLYT